MKSKLAEHGAAGKVPTTLHQPGAVRFWLAIVCTGISTGIGAAILMKLLEFVQRLAWGGSGTHILEAAKHADPLRCILVLLGAGVVVSIGQLILEEVSSGNGMEITEAIWFSAGRLPKWQTVGSAILSIIGVAMGVSLGREGAPKQMGGVFADLISDGGELSDEQRRLLVACGAGAGMGAAYGVPIGGALFALEVVRGVLALRLILPALLCSILATMISWLALPDAPTYDVPKFSNAWPSLLLAIGIGPIAGVASVLVVRAIAWAQHHKPRGWLRFIAPPFVMGALGVAAVEFPELLGNGSDTCQLLFTGGMASGALLLPLLLLKPAATVLCLQSGTPGGLFTPSLTIGALLGATLGWLASLLWPETPLGLAAILGGGAVVAATTQGPISAVVLVLELTGRDRSFVAPLLLAVCLAALVARTLEPRSIYDVRLPQNEIKKKLSAREPAKE